MREIKELLILLRDGLKENKDGNIYYALIAYDSFNIINEEELNLIIKHIKKEYLKSFESILFGFSDENIMLLDFLKNSSKEESIEWLNKEINKS